MQTYSINIGTSTEATTYNLISSTYSDISVPLQTLPDNTNREISPGELRSAILTLWSNSIFTQTNSLGNDYIGIDTSNPTDKDLKNKIYFGKRSFSGTFSYYSSSHDIMSTSLLNSDVDVFLFNTKRDTVQNNKTVISVLAGTQNSTRTTSPYLQSEVISGTTSVSLDIVNPSILGGNINIYSGQLNTNQGTVSVSNIIFPSFSDSYGFMGATAAGNGRLLYWYNGKLIWNGVYFPPLSVIGATGQSLNIFGSPVYLNNQPLSLTDTRLTPLTIGDIPIGSNFSLVEMVEVLRRIVYDYSAPLCSVSLLPPYSSGYLEVGSSPIIKLRYSITKRTNPTQTASLNNMVPSSYPAITSSGQVVVSGTASGVIISPVGPTTTTFTISVTDGTQSNSDSTQLTGVYPYFYGFSSLSTMNTNGLSSLTKLVEPQGDKTLDVTGSGNLYFIYDANYANLSQVLDNYNLPVTIPTPILTFLSSPSGLWASKQFKVYKFTGIPQLGPPSVNYQFKY